MAEPRLTGALDEARRDVRRVLAGPVRQAHQHALHLIGAGDLQQLRHRPMPAIADQRHLRRRHVEFENLSSSSLSSGTLVEVNSTKSGRALRTGCTSVVASVSGGV
jgi:hypothetical protein